MNDGLVKTELLVASTAQVFRSLIAGVLSGHPLDFAFLPRLSPRRVQPELLGGAREGTAPLPPNTSPKIHPCLFLLFLLTYFTEIQYT